MTLVEVERKIVNSADLLGSGRSTDKVSGLVTVSDVVTSYDVISTDYLTHKTNEIHPGMFEQYAWLHLANGHLGVGRKGLDGGGGTGWLARVLARAYPSSTIVNLDASQMMISLSIQSNADMSNMQHKLAVMHETNFDDKTFDFIGSSRAVDCIPPTLIPATFQEFYRILTDDGVLIVAVCDEKRNQLYALESGVEYSEGNAYREHWPGSGNDLGDGVLRFYNANSYYIEQAALVGFKLVTSYNPRPPEDMRHNRNTLELYNRYSQRTSSFIMQFEKEQ